jgi:hypothetical protein
MYAGEEAEGRRLKAEGKKGSSYLVFSFSLQAFPS